MAKTFARKPPSPKDLSLAIGRRAKIRFGSSIFPVIVIEDRGPIGSMGRHLMRVRPVGNVDENSESFEVAAEELVFTSGSRRKLKK